MLDRVVQNLAGLVGAGKDSNEVSANKDETQVARLVERELLSPDRAQIDDARIPDVSFLQNRLMTIKYPMLMK